MADLRWRRQATDAVRRTEERFSALVQHSADAVVVLDAHGEITYASPSVEQLFGWAPERVEGACCLDFIVPEDRERVIEEDRLTNESGAPFHLEYRLLAKLASDVGRVFSRDELVQLLGGYDEVGSSRVVDVHVRRLRAKLGEEHAGLIQTVRSVGYRFGQSRWGS